MRTSPRPFPRFSLFGLLLCRLSLEVLELVAIAERGPRAVCRFLLGVSFPVDQNCP